jgi:ubiquinol-cytochrome c reductase cytochrome b subunit
MHPLKHFLDYLDDRTGVMKLLVEFARHPVPPNIGWAYVLGSATLVAFVIQVVTGIALATAYVPSAAEAYESLKFISNVAPFGSILRGTHFFGASAMVVLIGLHMMRTFLMGSYKFPREVNWISGVVLLAVTLAMAFTGQLLRWDQNAIWSVVVAAEQVARAPLIGETLARFTLAGDTVGGATLSRFFAFHAFFIPAIIFTFIGIHLYLVLRNGISEPPEAGHPIDPKTYRAWYQDLLKQQGIPFFPDVAWRDIVFGFAVLIVILLLATTIGPPALDKPPDPAIIEATPRPDWFFLWYFAFLALLPHETEQYFIIYAPLAFGALLIFLPIIANRGERSPWRRPWAVAAALIAIFVVARLGVAGEQAPWSPDFAAPPLPPHVVRESSDAVSTGAELFHSKGCELCHSVGGYGGQRGPDLTAIATRLTPEQMTIRILTGGKNMPSFAANLNPDELDALIAFLMSRRSSTTRFAK